MKSQSTFSAPRESVDVRNASVDWVLLATVCALVAFGVVAVYSASAVWAHKRFGSGQYFLIRQSCYAAVGMALMFTLTRIDYRRYRRWTYPILGLSFVLLILVAVGVGSRAGGAARWIALGPIHIQPTEVTKLALVLWLAHSLSRKSQQMRSFSIGFLPHVLVAGVLMLLCLKQPDFGSAVILALITFMMLFAAGAKTGYILGAVMIAAPMAWALVTTSEYRMRRIRAFLSPFEYRYDAGYQVAESLISFGSGGVTGVGLGDSHQKLFFLPEAHTDFISAIIGEEMGLVGIALLLLVFLVIAWRGIRIALRTTDEHGAYMAVGITMLVGVQALTNIAVAMGMLPTKGLVLPFVSYGGSSLLVNCAAMGILLNISRTTQQRSKLIPQGAAI